MIKLFLLHGYNKENKGDAAILSVMLLELRKVFANCSITISTLDNAKAEPVFEDTPQITSLFYEIVYKSTSNITRIWLFVYIPFVSIVFILLYRITKQPFYFLLPSGVKIFFQRLIESDLVIGVGGGYILGHKGLKSTISLLLTLWEFRVATRLGKPVILLPQSIGPFSNSFQQYAAKKVLNKMEAIFVREPISRNLLRGMQLELPKIIEAPDLAFSFSTIRKEATREFLEQHGVVFTKPVLGITVRESFDQKTAARYETVIAQFVDFVAKERGMQIVFIPQVTAVLHNDDDRVVQRRIENLAQTKNGVLFLEGEYDHYGIKGIYENMTYVVGTRMHSVIFSLTGLVPCIAISYEHKTEGVMADLGLSEWVLYLDAMTLEDLKIMFQRLENSREKYIQHLQQVIPQVQRRSISHGSFNSFFSSYEK